VPELGGLRLLLARRSVYCRRASVRPLLALEDGRPVATVAAFADDRIGADVGERVGALGCFEALPNAHAAVARLVEDALAGLRAWGAAAVRAPQNGHPNYGFGLLVDPPAARPLDGLACQPAYYAEYLAAAGFEPVHRYAAFTVPLREPAVEARIAAARAARPHDVQLVPASRWRFRDAVARFADLHSRAFVGVWGDTPFFADEAWELLGRARLAIPRGFFRFAEVAGRPVGFVLCLPDYNQLWEPGSGAPTPLGTIVRAALWGRRITRGGLYSIGLVPGARRRGIGAALVAESLAAMRRRGLTEAVYALVLDDNAPSRALATRFGGVPHWGWAMYERRPA
jgi:ribosomal protein S18 acetylase RimI-like enzyme